MNRRELFKNVAASIAATGVVVERASVVAAEPKAVFAIFETNHLVSQETARYIAHFWERSIEGTPLEGTKAFVLSDGLKLTLLDANGRVINRPNELEG